MTDKASKAYKERQRTKATLEQFRAAARAAYDVPGLKVTDYGCVSPCEGGAYVEAVLWVPDSAVVRSNG